MVHFFLGEHNMKIKTHDGIFHADEIFACALLNICFNGEIEIVRTRDENITADLYIDIGGKFDNVNYFDHHYKEFNIFHDIKKTIPKASFGLIWDKFSYKLNKNEKILKKIKSMFVVPIDAHDNNIRLCKYNEANYNPYTISNIISVYNRRDGDENSQFYKALNFAVEALYNIIHYVEDQFKDEEIVKQIFDSQTEKTYIIFDKYYNYANAIKDEKYSHITHLIFPEKDHWRAICIKDNGSQELKAPFPKEWGGLTGNDLIKVSDIEGCIFCHRGLWFAVNQSLKGIISMVETALNK